MKNDSLTVRNHKVCGECARFRVSLKIVVARSNRGRPVVDVDQSTTFSEPDSMDSWATKGTLGERVWLNRDKVPVPEHHRRVPNILSAVSAAGSVFVIWGVVTLEIWPTLFGAVTIYLGKLWFVDRMVWLYHDMKDANQEYSSW